MVCRRGEDVVGFVNGTLSKESKLTHESMSHHDPQGSTLCIHSVVVRESLRRQGLGRRMLRHYVEEVQGKEQVRAIALICKEYLVDFYKQCGFVMVGPSDVEHGADPWYEMRITKLESRSSRARATRHIM